MSLLVRAALLGGVAYMVARAVRNSQHSIESSRLEAQRLARTTDDELLELGSTEDKTSTSTI